MFLRCYAVRGLCWLSWSGSDYCLHNPPRSLTPATSGEMSQNRNARRMFFEVLDSWATVGRILREAKERDPNADFGAVERAVRSIDCAMGRMPYNQVYAIVDRHMNQHPEMWHELMATIVWNALYGACAR